MQHPDQRNLPVTLVIIVNYHSAKLCLSAVRSVVASESLGPVHVVVVDNSVDETEADMLRRGLPTSVERIINTVNIGFGNACNRVFEKYPGAGMVLLLNPDARLRAKGLIRLQRSLLSHPRMGAVGPQLFWDDSGYFYLPPSIPVELTRLYQRIGLYPGFSEMLSLLWRRYALYIWNTTHRIRVLNLCGGHVLLKSEAVRKAGGLFDPRFFLYYEDMDLFYRLRKSGYRLFVEPSAEVVHTYDQCGQKDLQFKRRQMAIADRQFREKYGIHPCASTGADACHQCKSITRVVRKIDALSLRWVQPGHRSSAGSARVPCFEKPFSLDVPSRMQHRWVLEWSPNSSFIPSVAMFGHGKVAQFPEECFDLFSQGLYFARLGSASDWNPDFMIFSIRKES